MNNASIIGIGTWLPEKRKTNDEWPESFSKRDRHQGDRTFNDIPISTDERAAQITAHYLAAEAEDPFLGAKTRYVADDSISSAQAEVYAAEKALEDAGITGSDIDVVLSNALVPDRVCPYNAPFVANAIGAKNAWASSMDQACATVITQLNFAKLLIESGQANNVLLTQSHLILRAMPPMHPAAPTLGDGASAFVVGKGNGLIIHATHAKTYGESPLAVTFTRGITDEKDTPWWKAGGDFHPGSRDPAGAKYIMRETVAFGAKTVREVAAKAGVLVTDIDVLASTMPRGFVPKAIAEHLGIPKGRAPTTYKDTAHLGVASIAFNLEHARKEKMFRQNGYIALYSQGSGFTVAAAILQVQK